MKFEKISENKIRITLTIQDLAEKEIDFHVFMSNSIESQDILLSMLEEAKKEIGFDPEDYNLKVEALALADTNFIFTITKMVPELEQGKNIEKIKTPKRKFTIKRKSFNPTSTANTKIVYSFSCFEDFCHLLEFLGESYLFSCTKNIAKSVSLYCYREKYYLLMNEVNPEMAKKIQFYTNITEFAKYVTNSKVFASKLAECGNLIMKDNAVEIGFEHFVK